MLLEADLRCTMSESQPQQTPDFSAFGPVESRPLTRMQVLVAAAMEKSWTSIPHVSHQEEADITALEALRVKRAESGAKISLLPFYVKAAVAALKQFPNVNASLDGAKKALILKQYYHIGIAIDVPAGLLVPVVRDADKKSLAEIGQEITDLAQLARTKGLPLAKMSGGCFTISSLGAIGGTAFTPIINPPELAIMGISRSYRKPCEAAGGGVEWKTVLPFSLSYDHRAVNGALAGNFCRAFADNLGKPEEL
jgi:pyruvate dehydrogenase E2 component (dihydrolipoamide acetyltransferase)